MDDATLPDAVQGERRLFALGLRLMGVSCLSIMVVFIKLAGDAGISTPELMFWRQFFALPVVFSFIAVTGGFHQLRTSRFHLHASRTLTGLFGMALTFSSYIMLPLAEATTLGFTVPIFATILAAVILKEKTGCHRWGAVIAGFVGVLVVVQPGSGHIPAIGAAVGLSSAFMIGLLSLLIRQLGKTESAATTVFYFTALSVPVLAPLLYWYAIPHDVNGWLALIGIGVFGGVGQIGLTASLRHAPVSTVVSMDYITLIWSTFFGWLIWNNLPTPYTWVGAPIIVASGLYIAFREHRLRIKTTREALL